eukprot:1324688-Amorphochlora_amoeboformis.AAC.1
MDVGMSEANPNLTLTLTLTLIRTLTLTLTLTLGCVRFQSSSPGNFSYLGMHSKDISHCALEEFEF